VATGRIDQPSQAGNRFRSGGKANRAEPLLRRAVVVADSRDSGVDGDDRLPAALNALGMLCKDLAKYDEARAVYERALAIVQQSAGSSEHDVATLYHNLGGIEHARGDFVAAEPLARRGLALRRRLGDDDEALARDLTALGAILDGQQQFDEAEAMHVESLAILERSPKRNAVEIAVALNNLGANYLERGRTTEALELLSRAEKLKRACLGARHPDLPVTLNNLAKARQRHGELASAQRLYREAVEILEAALGPEHPKAVVCRNNLSTLEKSLMSTRSDSQSERAIIRIDLTPDQKQVVRAATSRDAEAIELTVDELEQRIAPSLATGSPVVTRLALNHNETLLTDAI
jgi:tetratricopeptide (TPR) repeat protein